MEFAKISYTGGTSVSGGNACNAPPVGKPNDAAIRIYRSERRTRARPRLTSERPTDVLPTNTFSGIARCTQSYPRDANGACPDTVPCPTE
jgi:hypothetical protein